MYGEPSGFTQAMRIGLPRARNASFSASDIPPTLPRQVLSVISRTSPSSPVGSGEPVPVRQTIAEPGERPGHLGSHP